MLRPLLALLLALLVAAPATALPVARPEEGPTDGACDDTGYLVCAGANAGATVSCRFVTPTSAACSWTSGHVWTAYSPVGLPGAALVETELEVESCVDSFCAVGVAPGGTECAWAPATSCDGGSGQGAESSPVTLAMGQCLKVTVTQRIMVYAESGLEGRALAAVAWTDVGEGAGAVCLVDDGRD